MKYIRFFISAIVVMAGIILVIYKLGVIVRPEETDGAHDQIETFHSLPQDSLDVIVYGSSHAWRGFDPIELYRKYGIGSYNYSWNWQKINTTKLFLQDSLATQKPKVALIESCFVYEVIEDSDVIPEVYYCRYIKDRKAKKAYMKQCMGNSPSMERRLSYIMPLAMFHDNWNDLTQANFAELKRGASDELLRTMGYMPSDKTVEITIPEYQENAQKELPLESLKELDEIIQICKEHNIRVVFYLAPYQGVFSYSKAMQRYALENDCVFLDLYKNHKEASIDEKTDFMDKGHLNDRGSKKIAAYIGQYLFSNFELTDYRSIDNNLWEQAIDGIPTEDI